MKKSILQSKEVKEGVDRVLEGAIKAGNELKNLLKKARERFENADEETKRKVVKGVVGAVAALTAIIGVRKIAKRRRAKK